MIHFSYILCNIWTPFFQQSHSSLHVWPTLKITNIVSFLVAFLTNSLRTRQAKGKTRLTAISTKLYHSKTFNTFHWFILFYKLLNKLYFYNTLSYFTDDTKQYPSSSENNKQSPRYSLTLEEINGRCLLQ